MQLTASASIQIYDEKTPQDIKLGQLRHELKEAMEDAANAVLERWKINNDEVHTVLVEELETDTDDGDERQ